MDCTSDQLLCIIRGETRPRGSYYSDICSLIRDGVFSVKRADDGLYDNKYSRSIGAGQKRREAALAEKEHLKRFRESLLTGNKDYDNLPDQVKARDAAESRYHRERFMRTQPIVQKMTPEQIAAKVDAEKINNFGGSSIGKVVGDVVQGVAHDTLLQAVPVVGGSPLLRQLASAGIRAVKGDSDDISRDTATNYQLQWNALKNGFKDVGRLAWRYGDPRGWGDSARAERIRQSKDNDWYNERALSDERARRIAGNFENPILKDTSSGIGKVNLASQGAVGELAGGTLATGGAGIVSKGIGSGIGAGTKYLSGAAGNAVTRTVNAASGGRAGVWATRAGNMAGRAVNEVGQAAATPFNIVGELSNPLMAGKKSVVAAGKGIGETATGGYNTLNAAIRPGSDLLWYLRHPVQNTRAAWQYAKQHPKSVLVNPYVYGRNYVVDVGSGLKQTATPAFSAVFNKPVFYGSMGKGIAEDTANRRYGDAAAGVGELAAVGALGGWWYAPELGKWVWYAAKGDEGAYNE